MKKIFITITAILSLSVLAHPTDKDSFLHIGENTKLTMKEDLNIPSHIEGLELGTDGESHCFIVFKEAKPFDRFIPKGTVYTINKIEPLGSLAWYYKIKIDSENGYLTCRGFNDDLKIGQFKKVINKYLEVTLPDPVVIR